MNKRRTVYPDEPGLFDGRYDDDYDGLPFDDTFSVASATDYTGLIPFAPQWEDEITSYRDMYDAPPDPIVADKQNPNKQGD